MTSPRSPDALVAIVDDDESMRLAVHGLLRAAGLRAVAFPSAEAFLSSGCQQSIGCLIADVRMPDMSGLELQAAMTGARIPVPIIFISAHGDARTRSEALGKGAIEFLDKPFDDERLLDLVRTALDRR